MPILSILCAVICHPLDEHPSLAVRACFNNRLAAARSIQVIVVVDSYRADRTTKGNIEWKLVSSGETHITYQKAIGNGRPLFRAESRQDGRVLDVFVSNGQRVFRDNLTTPKAPDEEFEAGRTGIVLSNGLEAFKNDRRALTGLFEVRGTAKPTAVAGKKIWQVKTTYTVKATKPEHDDNRLETVLDYDHETEQLTKTTKTYYVDGKPNRRMVIRYSNLSLNPKLDASLFEYKKPTTVTPPKLRLLQPGETAPAFTGKTFDNKPISLAKELLAPGTAAVLLSFWYYT